MSRKITIHDSDGYIRLAIDDDVILEGDSFRPEHVVRELCDMLDLDFEYIEVGDEFFNVW